MIKTATIALLLTSALSSQSLSFSRQITVGRKQAMDLWAVSGTAGVNSRPPNAATVYEIATKHGLRWILPSVASARLAEKGKRSAAARIYRAAIYAVVGGKALADMRVITLNPQVSVGLSVAVGLTTVLLPLIQQDLPSIDPAFIPTTAPLMDSEGAIEWLLFAEPSHIAGFTEAIQ